MVRCEASGYIGLRVIEFPLSLSGMVIVSQLPCPRADQSAFA